MIGFGPVLNNLSVFLWDYSEEGKLPIERIGGSTL